MTTSKEQVSVKTQQKVQEVSADEATKSRKSRESTDSPLMSPVALMALGLAGAATAAISKEFLSDGPATAPDASLVGTTTVPDALAATELVVDSASPIATQMNALIQELLAEKATSMPHQGSAMVAGDAAPEADVALAKEAAGTAPASVAVEELPMLLAQASTATPTGVVSESAATGTTGAGAASGGAAAAVATSTAASTALLIGAGLLGVAMAGSSSSSGGVATPTPPPSDTTPPVIQSLTIGGDKILTLTYDSALDSSNLPPLTAFKVTTNGVDNPVTVVAVNGSALTLTLTNSVAAGTLHLTYTDPTAGNDALAVQDIAGNDAVSVIQGIVADGYVRDAQIYIDVNKNGVADSAEIVAGVVTDANGNFFLPSTAPAGTIIAKGGVNIDTGVANNFALKAPAGSTTVNPLTTLVQAVIDAAPTGTTITSAAAAATVSDALGLTLPAGTSLTTYDPLSATDVNALSTQQVAAQVATLLSLAGSAPATGTTTTQAVDTVIDNLVDLIKSASGTSTTIDLAVPTVVEGLFEDANDTSVVTSDALSDAQIAVVDIAAATSLAEVTLAQSAALDKLAPAAPGIDLVAASDTGTSATDNITSDTTPTLRVSLEVTKTDGTAVVAGDTVVINDGVNRIGTATVTVADVAQGFIDVTLSEQADASYSLTSAVIDKGTNASAPSANLTVTIDTTVAVPATTLTTNSGLSTDSITNVGTVSVAGLETGATWEYSVNGGTFAAGTGTSVTLAGDGDKLVTVRQTDVAGNVSVASTALAFTLDGTASAPTLALVTNSGVDTDSITNVGTVNVTDLETGASWEYSLNAGTSWTAGTGTSVTLTGDGAKSVTVRQTDVAGNVSAASTALVFTLDSTASAPVATLATNSGVGTDSITNVGTVNVTGLETGASWQYSLNAGTNWTAGTGTSVTLTGDDAKSVTVRQTDVAGNVSAASTALAFTLDGSAPAVSPASPADGGLTLGLAANLVLAANETLVKGSGTISIFKVDNSLVETIDVNGNQVSITGTGANTQISIDPSADLTKDTQYYVQVSSGAFTDVAGNAWVGIADATTWNFTGAGATVVVGTVAGDDMVNLVESGQTITVTGTLGAEAGVLAAYTTADMTAVLNPVNGTGVTLTQLSYSYTSGATGSWSAVIPAASLSGTGHYTLSVTFTGSTGAAVGIVGVGTKTVHVDTVVAAPTPVLTIDTGNSNSDQITNNGALTANGTEDGATVQYSTDGGSNWASSFTAVAGANTVQVRQTDMAGNVSAASTPLSFTLDTTAAAAPVVTLTTDTGTSTSDKITSTGEVSVTGTEQGATVQYSTDGGVNWTSNFTALAGANSVQVRQTDVAGNVSAASTALTFTLDTAAAAPVVALTTDTGSSSSDKITSNGAVTVTGAEQGATVQYSTDGGSIWTSNFTAVAGANSVQVRQTDVAGNVSAASTALAFTLDTVAAAPVVTLTTDTGSSASDKITSNGALAVSGAEQGAVIEYSTNGGSTWSSSFTAVSGNNSVQARQTDVAGNVSDASAAYTFTLDSTAPTVAIEAPEGVSDTGVAVFNFAFSEAVTGFDASDIVVANGSKGTFTATDASNYSLAITPTSSTSPISFTVNVAAGSATDVAGVGSAAASQFLASILFGTSGNDTLTVGAEQDQIFLGAGADVIKLTNAAHSTVASPDSVFDFGQGDKIDLSTLLGTGSGYTGSALADTGAAFVELKDLTITQNVDLNTTLVRLNVYFADSSIMGSKIEGAVIDLSYDYGQVSAMRVTSTTYADPTNGGDPSPVWPVIQSSFANGKIVAATDFATANPVTDSAGKVFAVSLTVSGLVNIFDVGLEAVASGGSTAITTADNVTHNVDVGVTKTAGLTVGTNGILEIITDTGTLGEVGDNQLHMVATYDDVEKITQLQVRYDTNSTFGATTLSEVIAFDFDGNVTANLTPASLTFI